MKSLTLNFVPKMAQYMLLLAVCCLAVSCGEDETPGGSNNDNELRASFQFTKSDTDWRVVSFMNFSQNADSYEWDFGDTNTSTEKEPSHSYSAGGTYTVTLTASDGTDTKTSSKTVMIEDPDEASKALTGETSKTWKLFREGISMSVGSGPGNPTEHWDGLSNDGSRPCLYEHEFTFYSDGSFEFDDKGAFWAEYGVFNGPVPAGCDQVTDEQCFEPSAASMVNACGDDVSAWGSGTHSFDYDPVTSSITLTGNGAWIGIPKLATAGETLSPLPSTTFTATIEQFTGYDVMTVVFDYGDPYWPIKYVNYSDTSLEPELVTDAGPPPPPPPPFGEDLPDISPTELSRTFASADAADWVLLDTIPCASLIFYGVDNPDGSGTKVGQFERIATAYQEIQMQTAPDKSDINFENLTKMSLDFYLPSTNDYSGALTKNFVIGFGDKSQTEEWWNSLVQWEVNNEALGMDEWHTVTLDLTAPNTGNAFDRFDLDMVFIGFGGGGHDVPGTYFIRNLVIN